MLSKHDSLKSIDVRRRFVSATTSHGNQRRFHLKDLALSAAAAAYAHAHRIHRTAPDTDSRNGNVLCPRKCIVFGATVCVIVDPMREMNRSSSQSC